MGLLGDLVVRIVGDTADFVRKVDESGRRMSKFDRDMKVIANSLMRTGKLLTLAVTAPIIGIGVAAIKSAADLEMQQAAFETMLGSAEKAKDLLKDLTDLAAKTPFQMTDLAEGTKTLLAFGVSLEDVLPTLKMLGDISLGDSEKMKSLSLVFGQMTSAGRLMGQDLLQMINVGFNPLQIISEKTGETMIELKKRMEQGGVSAAEVTEAFKAATSEGGRFFGGMERASLTLTGLISTFKDNVAILGRSFAEVLMPTLKRFVERLTEITQKWLEMDEGTRRMILRYAGIAAAIGPMLIAISGAIKVFQSLKITITALNIAMSANPAIAIGVGIAALATTVTLLLPVIRRAVDRHREYKAILYDTANAVRALSREEQEAAKKRLEEERLKNIEELRKASEELADVEEKLTAARANAQYRAVGELQNRLNVLTDKSNILTKSIQDQTTAITEIDKALAEQAATVDAAADSVVNYTDDLDSSGKSSDIVVDRFKILSEGLALLQAKYEALGGKDGPIDLTSGQTKLYLDAIEGLIEDGISPENAALKELIRIYQQLANEKSKVVGKTYEYSVGDKDKVLDKDVLLEGIRARLTADRIAEQQALEDGAYYENRERFINVLTPLAEEHEAEVAQLTADRIAEQQALEDGAYYENLDRLRNMIKEEEEELTTFADWYEENYVDRITDAAQGLFDALTGFANARADADIAAIEASTLAEEEKDAQILAIKQRQARREKAMGIFGATIDTAQAIIGLLADPGGVAGVVLSIAAAATGLAQIATIAATPLPQMASGGIVAPSTGGTPVVVGEGGQDEMILPLSQLGDLLSRRGDFGDVGSGDLHVTVELEGEPIFRAITEAARNRQILIHPRAVTA